MVGSTQHIPVPTPRSAVPTCGLSTRSCAFGATTLLRSPRVSFTSPVIPAAGSACPMFALTPPTGSESSPRGASTAAASERASIGSPSAVPVPCASFTASPAAATPASARAARSKASWARPLGAVRLALRPSWRTILPCKPRLPSSVPRCNTTPQHASARAYPSARVSNVFERPRADVMPAMAKAKPIRGVSMSATPATRPALQSASCKARNPA